MLCKHDPDCPICRKDMCSKNTGPLEYILFIIFSVSLIVGVLLCLKP